MNLSLLFGCDFLKEKRLWDSYIFDRYLDTSGACIHGVQCPVEVTVINKL